MSEEPRKASDVLIKIENDVSQLKSMVSSFDLLLKMINNKLTELLANKEKLSVPSLNPNLTAPQISVEAVDTSKNVFISSESTIKVETSPEGFRRTSRPETFGGDKQGKPKAPEQSMNFPTQIPRAGGGSEVISNSKQSVASNPVQSSKVENISVKQRVLDGNGNSIFMADVEIFNNNKSIHKTRTNGVGKWMASLPIGNYKVSVKRKDPISKEMREVYQNVQVTGNEEIINLPEMNLK